VAKVPSVPADPSRGVLAGLDRLAATCGVEVSALLEQCAVFVHGSTVATNTVLEGKGARVALLTSEGFRDALEIRRGLREDQWDHRAPYAPVLVPRYLRRGVGGRIDADGAELVPLDEGDVRTALEDIRIEADDGDGPVEAIAIALFNSFLDDAHERRAAEIVADGWDGWVTRSAEISPLMGEYERTSTAVMNAALGPRIMPYLRALDGELAALGLRQPLLMVQSNGGAASVDTVAPRPVNLLLSGPAAAVGAMNLYRRAIDEAGIAPGDEGNLISMEIGGTSCDVLLMANGQVATRDDLMIAGYHVSTPAIDIHTIGAGGGTIAGVDSAGLLYVGPKGAGADPGPACYGLGGTEPTVTDALLVLGRLRAGTYAGGSLTLDAQAARDAIAERVARPLGISVEDAAAGIISLLEQNLLGAVEYISIERGHAPRRFTLVAAGGAGPMHGEAVARGLGCRRVYVPRSAGALCAVGMLHADIRQDFSRFLRGSLDDIDADVVATTLDGLRSDALAAMAGEGFSDDDVSLSCELDLHHPGQLWSIRMPVPAGEGLDRARIRREFETEYERLYGHAQENGTIMIASARVTATASTGVVTSPDNPLVDTVPQAIEHRKVWHGEHGWLDTPVYAGADLVPGVTLTGPALIEELTTTVLVGPGTSMTVDRTGNFLLDLGDPGGDAVGEVARAGADVSADAATGLDPVVLSLMQNRLDQISRHMGWVMTRTARSTIFSQSHDFSCFVTDPDGVLIANADGIPIHTGGGGFAARAILGAWPGDIHPGDVFLLSDPYEAGGNHLPDWVIGRPIFLADDGPEDGWPLIGFCCNRAHQSDIGGGLAGTYNPEATEIWHEGIRLPVLKLYERGVVRRDLWKLLLLNCRTPELLDGDLLAMVGSTRIGGDRVADLARELGIDSYLAHLAGVLDHAEHRMREAIRALPDGVYHGADLSDNDCFGPLETWIRLTLTVQGEELILDFSDSDPQMRGFKNSSLANTYSAAYLALSSFFDTDIPRNEGTYRSCRIIAPEGTIVNARPPAPMTMNTVFVAHEIVHAVWRALAEADPSRALAGWSKTMHGHVAGHNDDGTTFVMYHWHAMGTPGATAERDGFAQMGHLISLGGLDIANLEFHEQNFPVRYHRWEFRTDAAGAGMRRGGSGIIYDAEVLRPAVWSFRAEGLDTPSGYGVRGGADGLAGQEWIIPLDEAADGETFTPPKYGVRHLGGPARMLAHTPGGGGWGDPFEREPERVLRDVRDGVVSVEVAARDYGVVIDGDGRRIDNEATVSRRRGTGG
jgi:N-methylhydantoinase A/oxoprolinase/acetone carboxylase beta subunit/N-methylhydantoinase B/oxoprolinase/acetone carboxylase alpha subunit